MHNILLVSMPFNIIDKPTISLGVLKQALLDNGLECGVIYSNMDFAHSLGYEEYSYIQKINSELNVGEWIFSNMLHPKSETSINDYLNKINKYGIEIDIIKECTYHIEQFIIEQARLIIEQDPKLVGVSSMFQQHCASLCLLKKIKELQPTIVTCMGGANCEHMMGLTTHKLYTFVDYIMLGEGDTTLPILGKSILEGTQLKSCKGVITPNDRDNNYINVDLESFRVVDTKKIKTPNYDEFFVKLKQLKMDKQISPRLLVESSRGCWWGEKCPCSFCSLNGLCNKYRCRDHQEVLNDLMILSDKYDLTDFQFTDNIIPNDAFEKLLPRLISSNNKYNLFFETKSNISKDKIKTLSLAGVHIVQAGLETLHPNLLKLLKKGVSLSDNIQFLKWSMEYGICVMWNLITQIPGSKRQWIKTMNSLIPLLVHLQPPSQCCIRLDRFSDYFNNPDKYNLHLIPGWTYNYIYPHSQKILKDLAYYFQDNSPSQEHVHENFTIKLLEWWNSLHRREEGIVYKPILEYVDKGSELIVKDTRPCRKADMFVLRGLKRKILLYCDKSRHIKLIYDAFTTSKISHEVIQNVLDDFLKNKIMVEIDHKYLALPLSITIIND